ncbi:MAG: ABC transporter ATP-binding protein [Dehalococcoidia bacterium]|jgi:ABC-2 type transport system ATP-binding protein|nr:ABC transporter ATP-binding protein [Dehalococcoidia bacterium]
MIEVNDLTKRFKEAIALDGISLRVGEGEVFGYLGPNGAGKTTTMRVLLGLMQPTSGEALLWGQRASESQDVRRRTGVLLESDGLYPRLSAYANLDYFARLYDVPDREARIARLLDFAGLTARSSDKVGTFSRGMRRKLGLVRALLHSPDLLMLDEPSAGLDPEAQKMVRDLIVTLSSEAQITVFLSSHDLDEVQRICGRVAILQRGKIRVCDTLKALQASAGKAGVDIVLTDRGRTEDAVRLLQAQPEVGAVTVGDAALSVTLRNAHGAASIGAVLEAQGIGVDEVRRSRRSLEEVYLEIVHEEKESE